MALSCNIYIVPVEKQIFFKEEASGLYSVSAYIVAKNLSLLPQQIIFPAIVSCITYWVIGFNPQFDKFLVYGKIYSVFLMILVNITGGGLGLLAGTIFPTPFVAKPVSLVIALMLSIFSGYYSSGESIKSPFDILKYMSVRFM
jgi:ABC-type multidrug transport system permease subunit